MDPTTQSLIQAALLGLVRHGLTTLAGGLVTLGAIQPGQQTNFTEIGAGVVVWVAGYAWSVYQKKGMIGIFNDYKSMKLHLNRALRVPMTVPQADSINAAIEIARK